MNLEYPMETFSLRRTPDLSPLEKLAKKGARAPKNLGVIVAPSGNPAAPFIGLVTADNKPVVRAALDRKGAAAFAANAIARIGELMPDQHQQALIEIDLAATGVLVPTPPPPPKDEDLLAVMGKVFEYQRKLLEQLARSRAKVQPAAQKIAQKAAITAKTKVTRAAVAKPAARAKSPR